MKTTALAEYRVVVLHRDHFELPQYGIQQRKTFLCFPYWVAVKTMAGAKMRFLFAAKAREHMETLA